MSKRNPIERSQYINNEYKEYLRSSFKFKNQKLQQLFEQQLGVEELFKGPYVDLNLPFKRGLSLDEMIAEGVVCKSFYRLGDMHFDRPLYSHQEESIRHICSGHSAIITTGTGSGKTESFLYPILNEIMLEIEKGNRDVGVRAIFLYPMNALLNDQIDRIRKILVQCPEITYGFFTGETKESVSKNYRETYGVENGIFIPDNEMVSREEIRKAPPHLLFTNYSMLEYLLIRPNDYSIFSPDRLDNWKFVVLDEAHTYHGALGIELSLLMRRLTGLATNKPRFILTSATLGEQGKSENEIINFARNLTSAKFDVNDIIFSKRVVLSKSSLKYKINGDDYTKLKKSLNDMKTITSVGNKYNSIYTSNMKNYLFELLISDRNVFHIYELLKGGSRSFKDILDSFNNEMNSTELIDLIDLINMAEKDGIGIFDMKYHSFVRPLAGAYITLGKDQKLSLTKTNLIDDKKAFEVGNCRYCNSPYIIGKIQRNEENGLDYLYQNNEVDIYENYGNNKYVGIDYFLMSNDVHEELDYNILEEYKVCTKCGSIHASENLNARRCDCGDSFQHLIYKVLLTNNDGDERLYNNINQCPCCGYKGRAGIVKSLNVGKDEGTALLAQILYEAIDNGVETKKKTGKLSLIKKEIVQPEESDSDVKQFLTFSDSRQQASFSAAFMQSNQVRMLQKRLIWKVIEDNEYRDVSVDELTASLTRIIKEEDLFSNDLSAHKNAWVATLIDLLKVDGSNDGEGLGLYFFNLDLTDIMIQIDEEDVKEVFGKYKITKNDLETIMQVIFGVFKVVPAINYSKSTLTPDEKKEALGYRRFDNYVMLKCAKKLSRVRSFLPAKGNANMVVRYVQKVCGCDENSAENLLELIFNNLAVDGQLLKKHKTQDQYQIEASKYVVKNYKTSKYYICSKCGRLTPYNVHDKCVQDKCTGTLSEVNPDEILSSNYYRKQYKNKKIESIVVKEHTAQLERKKAKEYQQDFKNKKINILSCSTTFEMGIDIGNLETVFMRNVPPSPANYVQRAGRAGRRKDSSAYILTYCGTGSHDYTYFCNPEAMISGVIEPPYFNVVNHKIIVRHLMATCLGFFFKKYPQYFRSIDEFVFGNALDKFKNYIKSHPDDLNSYINKKILPDYIYKCYHNFKWFDENNGNDEKLNNFVSKIKEMAEEFENAKREALYQKNYHDAEYYQNQINKLHNNKVLESLSKYCVIPKYGFPVDVVELQIYEGGSIDSSYDLSRDLKIAISEYAPDSEIIVDGKKYTSKYISLPKTGQFTRNYYRTCPNCKKCNVSVSDLSSSECIYCGAPFDSVVQEFYIEPINGFKTGITKESTRSKPKRSYSGEVLYLGGGKKDENAFSLSSFVTIETSSNDELLVLNKSSFKMCPVCGYSEIVKEKVNTPAFFKKHKNYRQYDCSCEELKVVKLGHRFQTDVARFIIPSLSALTKEDYAIALSFMYAFLEGISIGLGIERNDIDGILEFNLDQHCYDIIIYDNVPGGAGHVKRLITKEAVLKSFNAARSKVSQQCCDEDTSCYNCLRNYYNQANHSRLKRKYARNFIESLLTNIGI